MSFDNNWEYNIYAKGKHINKYPYGELVSIFFNSLKFLNKNIDKEKIKVLELGCGSGNNLLFFAELGFDTYGIEGSKTACKIANDLLNSRKLKANINHAYFDKLPYNNETMDILVDRESTYCGRLEDVKKWWNEANRVLKKGGIVISFRFADDNPDLLKIKNKKFNAEKIENNTYKNISGGTFKNTGIVHFSSYEENFDIFDFCDIKFINKNKSDNVYNNSNIKFDYSEWIIIGVKK